MKKIIRLTESELIKVIKNVIKEQVDVPQIPSDTIVKKYGTDIKIGIEGKESHIYSLTLPILGKTEVTSVNLDLNAKLLKIEIAVPFGLGGRVESKLGDKKDEMKESGIYVSKVEVGTTDRQRFLFKINLGVNKKVSQGIINARSGTQQVSLTSDGDVKLKIV
jgi:hypothetical protein